MLVEDIRRFEAMLAERGVMITIQSGLEGCAFCPVASGVYAIRPEERAGAGGNKDQQMPGCNATPFSQTSGSQA